MRFARLPHPGQRFQPLWQPRLNLRCRSPLVAIAIVIMYAAAFAVISADKAPASAPTESALVHRLTTCLAPGQAKPTVVLVHGAWADTSSWRGEVATLQAAGYDVRAIANPLQNLTTDSQYVAAYLKAIHGPVVLAGHSYGGSVITNAAAGLTNVKRLVYVDAAAPAHGQTTGQLSGAGSALIKMKPAELFFTTANPTSSSGAPELYLRRAFSSTISPMTCRGLRLRPSGRHNAAHLWLPSPHHPRLRPGKQSRPGTSSVPVIK
jgi:pimeloyl-ACP methyl ester carboxylesterase